MGKKRNEGNKDRRRKETSKEESRRRKKLLIRSTDSFSPKQIMLL